MYRHECLGYAPRKNEIFIHKEKYLNGESMEAIYTIDENGLRRSMPDSLKDGAYENSIIFFGGSFTFV